MKARKLHWLRRGFTLVEIVVVLGVVSVLASAGYYTASSVQESARENKLDADIASLNSAVQIYEAVGGDISNLNGVPGGTAEARVLNKLKARADIDTKSKFNGITGTMLDPRIAIGEYVSTGKRAMWNVATERFEVAQSGSGVKEFVLSDAAASEARGPGSDNAAYARGGRGLDASNIKEGPKWVWEYSAADPLAQPPVVAPDVGAPPAVPGPLVDAGPGAPPVPVPVPPTPTPTPSPTPPQSPTPTPTPIPTPTPTPTATPGGGGGGSLAGVIVSQISKMNGVINGDTQLLKNSSFNWNGSTDFNGDLYLPGTPTISGNLIRNSPGSITVITGTGSPNPAYNFTIDAGSIDGNIYTRTDPNTAGLSQKDARYVNYQLGTVTDIATNPVTVITTTGIVPNVANGGTNVTLAGGNYGSVTVGGTLKLGAPNTTTYYNFNELRVNGGGTIQLLGPVEISLKNGGFLNNVIGTTVNQAWLTIYSQGQLTINGGGGIYGKKIVSSSTIEVNGVLNLTQGIIANAVGINSGGSLTVGVFTSN